MTDRPNWTTARNAAIFAVAAILYRAVLAGFGEDFATSSIGGVLAATWIAVGWMAHRRRDPAETTSLRWDIPVALVFFGGSSVLIAVVTRASQGTAFMGLIAAAGLVAVGVQMAWAAQGEEE